MFWVHSTRLDVLSKAFLPSWLALHHIWSPDHASFSTDLDPQLEGQTCCAWFWCLLILFLLLSQYYDSRNLPSSVDAYMWALSFLASSNMDYASGCMVEHHEAAGWSRKLFSCWLVARGKLVMLRTACSCRLVHSHWSIVTNWDWYLGNITGFGYQKYKKQMGSIYLSQA